MRGLVCKALVAGALAATLACSGLKDPSGCAATPCVSTGLNVPGWTCLGNLPPLPVAEMVPPVTYTIPVVDWESGKLPDKLTICVCSALDTPPPDPDAGVTPCAIPLGDHPCAIGVPPMPPSVPIPLPAMRDDLSISFLTPNTLPERLLFYRAPTQNLMGTPPIRLISLSTALSIAYGYHLILDPTKGVVVLRIFDCDGQLASNVHFTLTPSSPSVIPFVFQQGHPAPIPPLVTDATGQFGFANAEGPVSAQAYLQDETPIGPAVQFTVRAGWVTAVDVRLAK